MTEVEIIGAAMFSLVLVGPATAASDGKYGMSRAGHEHHARVIHRMPMQGLGIASPTYYRRWPGPYDDGNFSDDHEDHMRVPPSANGG